MRRPGYREAVEWLTGNDDCYWLGDVWGQQDGPCLSVSAAMVRDLYDVSAVRLVADLRRALAKAFPNHEALRGAATNEFERRSRQRV